MSKNSDFYKNPLLLLQIAGWSAYIMVDIFDHLKSGYYEFIPSLIGGLSACALTGLVAVVSGRLAHNPRPIQVLVFAILLYLAAIIWHKIFTIVHTLEASMTIELNKVLQYSLSQWLQTGYMPLFLFLAWSGFYVGSRWFLAHKQQQIELNEALLNTRQAQLQTLRYQLNPHFLFNILNSVDVSVLSKDNDTAHKMLQHLSGFLRNSLEQGEQDKIALQQEFSVLSDFVGIEKLRFGEALSIDLNLPNECKHAMLPPMLLQPLMENAIKFAWTQSQQGRVHLVASKNGHQLNIRIENSRAQDNSSKSGTGTGLRNTLERLALVYGDDASMTTEDSDHQFVVQLVLPWEVAL